MNIILLGAPGAGKGTQAAVICKRLQIPTISTGNIIRAALKSGTEMGLKAKTYMDDGKLVPDEIVIGIIKERLAENDCKNGFVLDGFPRTIPQAEALDKLGVQIDKVIEIQVSDREIVSRLSGRRVCEICGDTYHVEHNPPKVENQCDKCNSTLVQRKDDHPETVKDRLQVYHEQTEPLKGYYQKQGKLIGVNGQGDIDEITRLTLAAIEA